MLHLTWLKSRSLAVNTRIGWPWRTRIVGPTLELFCTAAAAADCPPPATTTLAPLDASDDRPPTTDSSIAAPQRSQKWLLTLTARPVTPQHAIAGDRPTTRR